MNSGFSFNAPLKPAFGFAGAALGLAAALLFSAACIELFGRLREEAAFHEFKKTLNVSNYFDSAAKLKNLHADLRLFDRLQAFIKPAGVLSLAEKEGTLSELHNILRMLDETNYEKALWRFNTLRDGALTRLLWAMPSKRENTQLLADIQKGFTAYLTRMTALKRDQQSIPAKIAENTAALKQLERAAQDLRQQLIILFSLPVPETEEEDSRAAPTEYYASGVLAELPAVPLIPDGVPDLIALRGEIEKVGGEVLVKGPDAPERFRERMDKMRADARAVRTRVSALQTENASLAEGLREARVAVFEDGKKLQEQLKELLLAVCDPNSSQVLKSAAVYLRHR